jgi:hypothetical protein
MRKSPGQNHSKGRYAKRALLLLKIPEIVQSVTFPLTH